MRPWIDKTRQLVLLSSLSVHVIETALVVLIIAIVASWMLPVFLRAQRSVYITTCLTNLNQIGCAIQMYHIECGAYPPAQRWHKALRAQLGPLKRSEDPLKCRADPSSDPVSYHYLDRFLLPYDQQTKPPCDIPLVIDETHHGAKATVLWYDYHQTAISKAQWLYMRSEVFQIRRDMAHPDSFRFIPKAPPSSATGPEEVD